MEEIKHSTIQNSYAQLKNETLNARLDLIVAMRNMGATTPFTVAKLAELAIAVDKAATPVRRTIATTPGIQQVLTERGKVLGYYLNTHAFDEYSTVEDIDSLRRVYIARAGDHIANATELKDIELSQVSYRYAGFNPVAPHKSVVGIDPAAEIETGVISVVDFVNPEYPVVVVGKDTQEERKQVLIDYPAKIGATSDEAYEQVLKLMRPMIGERKDLMALAAIAILLRDVEENN